jgi:acyl-CoA dehydrogenase
MNIKRRETMAKTSIQDNQKTSGSFYTDEHHMFRDSLRRFLEKEAVPYFEQWEKDHLIPRSFWEKMGQNGFICPWVSEEYGGMDTDFGFAAILSEELARVGA